MAKSMKELSSDFLAHRHALMAFIHGLVRDPNAAEDVFQEVWIRLAEAGERGVEIRDVPKWSRGTARNLILHYWRSRRSSKVLVNSEMVELAEQAFEESPERWAGRRQALVECIHGVQDRSRQLLHLKYELGMSAKVIAGRLRKTSASVLMALSRLRRALAECVEKRLSAAETGT